MTKNPELIEKKAIVNLNNVGLPVFLNPINDIIPIDNPVKKPIKLSIFSNKKSNTFRIFQVNYFKIMNNFVSHLIPFV